MFESHPWGCAGKFCGVFGQDLATEANINLSSSLCERQGRLLHREQRRQPSSMHAIHAAQADTGVTSSWSADADGLFDLPQATRQM